MKDCASVLDFASEILASVQALIGKMRAPLWSPARPRVALFLTIAEQFEAALHLARGGMGTHSAVHVRSMLEALVAMNLLGLDKDYVDQMRFEKLRAEKKVYQGVLSNQSINAEQRVDLEARLAACKTDYDSLFAKGLRPKRISEDLSRAGLADLSGPYTILCGFSHNDLAVVAFRHQGDDGMTYCAPVPADVMQTIFSTAMVIVVTAARSLNEIAKFPEGYFEHHYQELDRILGDFLQAAGRAA